MKVDRYVRLKSKVDQLRRETDRAQGALEQELGQLREEFDCGTVEEAEEKSIELKKQARKLEGRFDREVDRFEEKWKEVLE